MYYNNDQRLEGRKKSPREENQHANTPTQSKPTFSTSDGADTKVRVVERGLPQSWQVGKALQVLKVGDAVICQSEALEVDQVLEAGDASDLVVLQPQFPQVTQAVQVLNLAWAGGLRVGEEVAWGTSGAKEGVGEEERWLAWVEKSWERASRVERSRQLPICLIRSASQAG